MITMCVPGDKSTVAYLSIFALLGLGFAQNTFKHSQVRDVGKPSSGVELPVCGRVTPHQTPFGTNGNGPDVRNFPWHANLYAEEDTFDGEGMKKKYRCGATIIQPNLLVTAAQCVAIGFEMKVTDSKKLFVMTGNVHRDYDSPHNTAESVRKSTVKNVYVHCQFFGVLGRNANNIALIELEEPLPLSETLSPACLNVAGYRKQPLVPGAYGRIAEFGGQGSGDILQTRTLPYISLNQCRLEALKHSRRNAELFTNDKFCAGYANGRSAPAFGLGGGLVFQKHDAWYLEGIHSGSLIFDDADDDDDDDDDGDDESDTERLYNSVYTKMSLYTGWIQEVISSLQRNEPVRPCDHSKSSNLAQVFSLLTSFLFI